MKNYIEINQQKIKSTMFGFTLVELLAVLVILGLLGLIVVPVVDKILKDSREDLYNLQIKNIEDGAKNWAAKNPLTLPENGNSMTKTIAELEEEGFIEVDVKNPKTGDNFCDDSYVTITNTGSGFTYSYDVNSGSC